MLAVAVPQAAERWLPEGIHGFIDGTLRLVLRRDFLQATMSGP